MVVSQVRIALERLRIAVENKIKNIKQLKTAVGECHSLDVDSEEVKQAEKLLDNWIREQGLCVVILHLLHLLGVVMLMRFLNLGICTANGNTMATQYT